MSAKRSRRAPSAARARASGSEGSTTAGPGAATTSRLLVPVLPLLFFIVLFEVVVFFVVVVVFLVLVLVVVVVLIVRGLELEGGQAVDHEARAALRTVDDVALLHVELVDFQIVRVARRAGGHLSLQVSGPHHGPSGRSRRPKRSR